MKELLENARKNLKGFCRVCPVCDGVVCADQVPGMGGLGTGASFQANIESLKAFKLNMKLIHDVSDPDISTSLLGYDLKLPVLASPIGGISFNMGGPVSEEEYINAVLGGCIEKGTLGCTGDGVPDIIHETAFSEIKKLGGNGIPFIKPWEDKELFQKLDKAAETGISIVGIDIDAAGLITLSKMGRPVFPRSVEKLEKIISRYKMKFILKGIMTAEDANRAIDTGASAIVVSNHGGRVLDETLGAGDVISEIVDEVHGKIAIIGDGGIRSGVDVLKMLALGADAVMIGRPVSIAAVGGLKDGVIKYLETIEFELRSAMVLTGCQDMDAVNRSILSVL